MVIGGRASERARRWLPAVVLIALVFGLLFRVWNVEHKIYSEDETVTSVRVAGHTLADLFVLFDGRPRTFGEVRQLTQTGPGAGPAATVHSLIVEDPQHPPAFYVVQAIAVRIFGDSPIAARVLPTLFGLLALPLMWWLCIELFGSKLSAAVAVALVAVSPFHVLYAYQAREYSLLAAVILLSSAVLLHAMRTKTAGWWILYAATVALGMYTYPLFAYVVISHAIVVFVLERKYLREGVAPFVVAAALGGALAVPWYVIGASHRNVVGVDLEWVLSPYPFAFMVSKWAFFAGATFFDLEYGDLRYLVVLAPLLLFVGYAFYRVVRARDRVVAVFVPALAGTTALGLIVPDLVLGHHFSTIARYLTPTWIALELAVAYLVTTSRRPAVTLAFIAVIASGVVSGLVNSRTDSWWEASDTRPVPQIAAILARSHDALFVCQNHYGEVLDLAFRVPPSTRIQLFRDGPVPRIHDGGAAFVMSPTPQLRALLAREQGLRTVRIYDSSLANLPAQRFRAMASSAKGSDLRWGDATLWRLVE